MSRYRTILFNTYLPAAILPAVLVTLLFLTLPVFAQDEDEAKNSGADAVELFNKAQDAHEKGDLAGAIELYQKAIAATAGFPEAEFQQGAALLSLGRKEEAEKAFRRAVELRPEWTLALANLGSMLVGKRQYPEADKLLTKAVELDDQNTLALSALTELRLNTHAKPGELKDLLARLVSLTGKAKPTAAAWAARGAIEAALGEKASARTSFDRALEIEPGNYFALVSKAGFLLNEGDNRGAEAVVKTVETLKPDDPSVKALRARLLLAAGKGDEAVSILNGIQDPPSDVVELRDRILLNKIDNGPELEKRLERNPKDTAVMARLCSAYRVSDPSRSLEYCRRAAEAEPDNINHAIGYAAALVQGKMFEQAVGLLSKLRSISPENVTIRANLATALFQMKRYAEAKAEYQWITEKQPSSAAAYYFLAIAHDQLAEYLDAMANYQLFLKYADAEKNKLEIEKANLRLPVLQRQIKEGKGKRT